MSDHPSYVTEDEARRLYSEGDAAHDFDHVLRVARLAQRIAAAEGADVTVVRLAGLLHDLPLDDILSGDETRESHHLTAAAGARRLLAARGLGTEQLENVVHAIEAHRFRDRTIQPVTLEAKCLYDADKLDSIGAMGVARAFAYAGTHGNRLWTSQWTQVALTQDRPDGSDYTPVHEYVHKLRHILDELHTATARTIGVRRHEFMAAFFEQLDAEMLYLTLGSAQSLEIQDVGSVKVE